MKKKTLQAAVIALGILSASFTVSAMGEDVYKRQVTQGCLQQKIYKFSA